jgi:hypothetical protein
MRILEQISTSIAAIPIPNAPITFVVVANVGQVPRIRINTGFSTRIPFVSVER